MDGEWRCEPWERLPGERSLIKASNVSSRDQRSVAFASLYSD